MSRPASYGRVTAAVAELAELGRSDAEIYAQLKPTCAHEAIKAAIRRCRYRGDIPAREYSAEVVQINLSRHRQARETIKRMAKESGCMPCKVARLAMLRGLAAMERAP